MRGCHQWNRLPVHYHAHLGRNTIFAITESSEIFMGTVSDLQLQLSTWLNCKQHNAAKFLVAYTPNGGVHYISLLYAGSISDVELRCLSGILEKLQGLS